MYRQDADGFAVPLTPASTFDAASSAGGSSRSSGTRLVENPYYRDMNLAENNIYMRDCYEEFPEDIAGLADHVHKDRDSPSLSLEQLRQNTRLYDLEMGTAEPAVRR